MQNASTPTTKTASKSMKPNPSQELIGLELVSSKGMSLVNFRKGKSNMVECAKVKITEANATGRRLTVEFFDDKGISLMTRRVYKEHVEKIAKTFGVDLP